MIRSMQVSIHLKLDTSEKESELDTPFVGPYIIVKCHGKGLYCLQLASNAAESVQRVSGAYLKPYQKPTKKLLIKIWKKKQMSKMMNNHQIMIVKM